MSFYESVFGVAPHARETKTVTIDNHELVNFHWKKKDQLHFYYKVGGGGGH